MMRFWKIFSQVAVVLYLMATPLQADEPQLLSRLDYGDYDVGFRLIESYDYGRPFYQQHDKNFIPRPVQISVWYPAEKGVKGERLRYRDMVLNSAREDDFKPLSPGEEKEFLQRWKQPKLGGNIKEKYLDRILELELRSRLKAPGAEGKFPLIIYSPSINSSPYENVVLIEYLVSHGYIVASYPSSGQYSGVMTTDWQGIMTCVQDAEFVLNYMHSFPGVDFEHIGGFGFSWGGITMSYLATRNYLFDAFVILDGSLIRNYKGNSWKDFPYYNPQKVLAPLIYMGNKHFRKDPNWEFHTGILKATVLQLVFHANQHFNFCSSADLIDYQVKYEELKVMLRTNSERGFGQRKSDDPGTFFNPREKMNDDPIKQSYETMSLYCLQFFSAWLKGDEASMEYLNNSAEKNGVEKGLISRLRIR